MKRFWMVNIFKGIVFIFLYVVISGYAVMYLWNWLIPVLFGVTHLITFWESIGLIILCKILFGSFSRRPYHGHRYCGRGRFFHNPKWKEKLAQMSPEEREKIKEEWKKHCGVSDNTAEKEEETR